MDSPRFLWYTRGLQIPLPSILMAQLVFDVYQITYNDGTSEEDFDYHMFYEDPWHFISNHAFWWNHNGIPATEAFVKPMNIKNFTTLTEEEKFR